MKSNKIEICRYRDCPARKLCKPERRQIERFSQQCAAYLAENNDSLIVPSFIGNSSWSEIGAEAPKTVKPSRLPLAA